MTANSEAIVLDDTIRISSVSALKETCDASASDLVIDASAVEAVDAAVLQFLVALRSQCESMSRAFSVRTPSDAFLKAAQTIGLGDALGLADAPGEA